MAENIDRRAALLRAFEFIYKSDISGDYHEFGVGKGVSLVRALKANAHWRREFGHDRIRRFFAYDSFEGLPVPQSEDLLDGYNVFKPGQFATHPDEVASAIAAAGLADEAVEFVVGRFDATLPARAAVADAGIRTAAIVHIDCDYYSSARTCLAYIGDRLIDGAVLLFDDWFCYRGRPDRGVRRAFDEWQVGGGWSVSEYFTYSWAGKAFIVALRP